MTNLREMGLAILHGNGLEIGAMHNPTPVPIGCGVEYYDVVTKAEAMALFPELPNESFSIEPKYIGDVDKDGLSVIPKDHFDFVILSHVIEHVANPIRVVEEIFRVVKPGGHVVIACPDKLYTFDKDRAITSFSHLLEEYRSGIVEVTDDHYLDFLRGVHPEIMKLPPEQITIHLQAVRERREHAHVWDSFSFKDFLVRSFEFLDVQAFCSYEVAGAETQIEYFSIWEKK